MMVEIADDGTEEYCHLIYILPRLQLSIWIVQLSRWKALWQSGS